MPPAELTKDLEFLPEIGERHRGLTRAAKSRTWFIIPKPRNASFTWRPSPSHGSSLISVGRLLCCGATKIEIPIAYL